MLCLKKKDVKRAAGVVTVLAVLSLTATNCKSNSSPDEDLTSTITVTNECGKTVDVYMDGAFQFKVETATAATITATTEGAHFFEAKITETTTLIYSETIEIALGYAYTFTVRGPSSITVTNLYGEILKISMDETYVGDIGDNLTQVIRLVKLGVHALSAAKRSDGTKVASTTIDVSEIKDYAWIITK